MLQSGRGYAPTLYTILVNPQDDERLFGYHPTLAGETETHLAARATEADPGYFRIRLFHALKARPPASRFPTPSGV